MGEPRDARDVAVQAELRRVRERFRADWAVFWGPVPFTRDAPFVHVVREDRDPSCRSALGFAVPIAGNAWAVAVLDQGGAFLADIGDAARDPRLAAHLAVVERNGIRSVASGCCLGEGASEVRGVVEVYSRGTLAPLADPIGELRSSACRLASLLVEAAPAPVAPAATIDPVTAAMLHDLRGAMHAQSLLVATLERDLAVLRGGLAPSPEIVPALTSTASLLRESVGHAAELLRLMSVGALAPGARVMVDLPGLVNLALAAVAPEVRRRFRVDCADELDEGGAVPDAPGVLRSLANLVQNAAQAIGDRDNAGVTIAIRASGDDVMVDVTDEGGGVPSAVLAHLFEPGVTSRPDGVGHGYGLYSARKTIENLGGAVSLYSVPGRGARFTIRLPRAAAGYR